MRNATLPEPSPTSSTTLIAARTATVSTPSTSPVATIPPWATAITRARGHHATLARRVGRLQRVDNLDDARRLADELADDAQRVTAALGHVADGLDVGCNHTCPELPTIDPGH